MLASVFHFIISFYRVRVLCAFEMFRSNSFNEHSITDKTENRSIDYQFNNA